MQDLEFSSQQHPHALSTGPSDSAIQDLWSPACSQVCASTTTKDVQISWEGVQFKNSMYVKYHQDPCQAPPAEILRASQEISVTSNEYLS